MTREEASVLLKMMFAFWANAHERTNVEMEAALNVALSVLRPVSREQVERVWTGCDECRSQANWPSWIENGFVYCPKCGTPLASWGWEKQVKRLETLKDEADFKDDIDSIPALTPPNEPLTLEQLREMDGEPVWVVYDQDAAKTTPGFDPFTLWALVEVTKGSVFLTNNLGGRTAYADDQDLEWAGITVYRRPPGRQEGHD